MSGILIRVEWPSIAVFVVIFVVTHVSSLEYIKSVGKILIADSNTSLSPVVFRVDVIALIRVRSKGEIVVGGCTKPRR